MPPRRDAETVLKTITWTSDPGDNWDLLVDMMNWPRVLFEAHGRHLSLDHGVEEDERDLEYHMCGECIAEVLKMNSTYPTWKKGRNV